ncbi:uncharacterized protein LOC119408446 [Nematolebias whitei]|uniref:uncharacterized protein LOC119408446 n=1 Tax=Nematolebias whitei TaxID=451745 RepID=UPI001898A056|nr:uncharacterized protein LOC119408446 [Nematolebias whitei]
MKLTRKKPDVPDAPGQSSTLPETDFEVPDDWCAPLGYKTAKKQKISPSVTLRKLSIPLSQVPINKEKLNCPSINLQRCKSNRRSRRISSLKEKSKPIVIKEVPNYVQGVNVSSVRNDNTILLRDVKHEDCALTNAKCLRKQNMGENTLTDKQKEKTSKHKKPLKKHAKKGTTSAELTNAKIKETKKYTCMFCSKLFETKPGRNIHARFHRTCTGCKKVLGGVYSLGVHTQSCAAYKKRMAQEAKKPPKICDRSSNTTVKPKVAIKNESVDVSIDNSKTFNKHTSSHKERTNVIVKN